MRGGSLLSSPFDAQDSFFAISSLGWQESLPGASDVRFQIRTSADGNHWTSWCGPDNGGAGCSSTTYFTNPSGGETIDSMFKDGIDDNYVQYRLLLYPDGANVPAVSSVTIGYGFDSSRGRKYSSIFTSGVMDIGESTEPLTVDWNDDVPLGTSLAIRVRAGNAPVPDEAWTAWSAVSKNSSLAAFNGNRYFQYEATFSTDGPTGEPTLYDISINVSRENFLISSPFDSENAGNKLSSISWAEDLPDENADINFQLSTSSDGINWTSWCGPDNGGAGCSSTTYFTNPSGGEIVDEDIRDGLNDRFFRYKAVLSSESNNSPTLSAVSIGFVVNSIEFSLAASSGSESTTSAGIQLALSEICLHDITVDYSITGGTASGAGEDYILTDGTARIDAGELTTAIPITIVNDDMHEEDETIVVTISNPTNAILGAKTVHTYTIIDDDPVRGGAFIFPAKPSISGITITTDKNGHIHLSNIPFNIANIAVAKDHNFVGSS